MTVSIYRGTAIYTAEKDRFKVYPGAYVVVEDGFVKYVLKKLPEDYTGLPVKDYGDALIIPAFSDLHIHASQYAQRGIGMDKLLFDWLNDYTFPQEAKFADCTYAEKVYDALVKDLIRHGTFHASIFTTIHSEASDCLFRKLAERGLYAYTGKVNMDCNSPDYLCEKTEESLRDTERFLLEHQGRATVKPILIPRFAPTCSEKLIQGLGKLAKKYACGVQTHLVDCHIRTGRADGKRSYRFCTCHFPNGGRYQHSAENRKYFCTLPGCDCQCHSRDYACGSPAET